MTLRIALAGFVIGFAVGLPTVCNSGEAGRLYAQQQGYSDRERQWFRDQEIPGSKAKCCSEADGEEVQEEIRGEYYWIKGGKFPDWTRVPKEAVIENPNLVGRPVVWWALNEEQYIIRCYSPGLKA